MFFLSKEESELAAFLATLKEGDWARLLSLVQESTRDDIRAGLGRIMGEYYMRDDEEEQDHAL